jgi:hypothetical protein
MRVAVSRSKPRHSGILHGEGDIGCLLMGTPEEVDFSESCVVSEFIVREVRCMSVWNPRCLMRSTHFQENFGLVDGAEQESESHESTHPLHSWIGLPKCCCDAHWKTQCEDHGTPLDQPFFQAGQCVSAE